MRCNLTALDYFCPLLGGKEIVDIKGCKDPLPNAVDAAQPLDYPGGVPGNVVVDNGTSPVQVYPFGELVRRHKDIEVIPLAFRRMAGVEIGQQIVKEALAEGTLSHQDSPGERSLQEGSNMPDRILVFAEYNHLAAGFAGIRRGCEDIMYRFHKALPLRILYRQLQGLDPFGYVLEQCQIGPNIVEKFFCRIEFFDDVNVIVVRGQVLPLRQACGKLLQGLLNGLLVLFPDFFD